jgi:hypothetical protein
MMPILLALIRRYLLPSTEPSSSALIDILHFARRSLSSPAGTRAAWKHNEDTQEEYDMRDREAIHDGSDAGEMRDFTKALSACKIFLFFTVYNIGIMGLNPLIISMAGSMTTDVSGLYARMSRVYGVRVGLAR